MHSITKPVNWRRRTFTRFCLIFLTLSPAISCASGGAAVSDADSTPPPAVATAAGQAAGTPAGTDAGASQTPSAVVPPSDLPAYVLYNRDGEMTGFRELVAQALAYDIIFFGELHNNPIAHWLRLELARAMIDPEAGRSATGKNGASGSDDAENWSATPPRERPDPLPEMVEDTAGNALPPLGIGFEMFERDQQTLLDEYARGQLSTANFEREARLWNNYRTDYKPLLELGRANELPLVATNIPRRYASMVYSGGLQSLDQLSDEAKNWIAPLPVEVDLSLPGYQNIMAAAHGHGGENLPLSQAVKDATMAHFIALHAGSARRFLHLNGRYHSDHYEGILWYLNRLMPDARVLTISTIESGDPANIDAEHFKRADFILAVPATMTKTY